MICHAWNEHACKKDFVTQISSQIKNCQHGILSEVSFKWIEEKWSYTEAKGEKYQTQGINFMTNCDSIQLGLELWHFQQYFSYIVAVNFIGGELKHVYLEKTSNLPQVTDKLYHLMLYWVHLTWVGLELTTLVVIGNDSIGSCKSNYHMIMTMTMTALLLKLIYIYIKSYIQSCIIL